jgi:hypothetical protein
MTTKRQAAVRIPTPVDPFLRGVLQIDPRDLRAKAKKG